MNRTMIWAGAAAAAVLLGYLALAPTGPDDAGRESLSAGAALAEVTVPGDLPEEARIGQRVFEAACAECHGENAAGRNGAGPPLVHRIYEPSHHGDGAFLLAARNGVRAHHWTFGDMPAVEGITDAEIGYVTRYVRALQEANGIF
jgi:mono/diheme cytochrome c family protein